MRTSLEEIEEDYHKVKKWFQEEDNLQVAYRVSKQIPEYKEIFDEVFPFLISAFHGQFRRDNKTPMVFHSIYLVRVAYCLGGRNLDMLLTAALHDVLEDTGISEEELVKQEFMKERGYLIKNLLILKEDKGLSREPDGINLPPRYKHHIKQIVGSPKEAIDTEILDRFSDLMDLEYILELPEDERNMRLKSKVLKVKSFVQNITRNRSDFNKDFLDLFELKAKGLENEFGISVDIPFISS